jgi:hypothetical protein
MEPIAVNVRRKAESGAPRETADELESDLQQARILATLMDSQFEFAGVKFGLDSLIGLVPVIGDTLAALVGTYPIYLARKYRLGRTLEMRMWANLAIDYFGGIVPVVGDAFDVAFKANLKNLALLERAVAKKTARK